jgi:hypothetical protein
MTVETVEYLADLDPRYPAAGEVGTLHEGDNHLRNIKRGIISTFPNFVGAAVTATEAELNALDGITASVAELNILDGVTASAAELNILDGVTATTAELNILDGVTATAAELNKLDGVTLTTAQINSLLNFDIQFTLPTGANGTYVLVQKASFGFTIDAVVHDTASGSITCAVQIDGTAVGSASALTVDSTETETTTGSPKTVSAGNTVQLVLSSNSSALGVSIQLKCVRT